MITTLVYTNNTKDHQQTKIGTSLKGKRNVHPLTILNINTIAKVGISKTNVHVCVLRFLSHPGGNTKISCRWSHLCTPDTFSSKIKPQALFFFCTEFPQHISTLPCQMASGYVTCCRYPPPGGRAPPSPLPPPPPGCWSSPWPRPSGTSSP